MQRSPGKCDGYYYSIASGSTPNGAELICSSLVFVSFSKVFTDTYATIATCGQPGVVTGAFCSASQSLGTPQEGCCAHNFSNAFGNTFILSVAARASLNVSSTATGPTASAACPTAHPTRSSHVPRSSKAVGVRVGVSLGVILLSTLCVLLYRQRKHRLEL